MRFVIFAFIIFFAGLANAATIAPQYTLPTASTSVLGGVKLDGSTINISSQVISAASTTLCGTTLTPGAANVGTLSSCSIGTLAVTGTATVPTVAASLNNTQDCNTGCVTTALGAALPLANGSTATTQASSDSSTKLATTAFAQALSQGGPNAPYVPNNNGGYYVLGAVNGSALTPSTPNNTNVRYQPLTVPQLITFTQLGIIVTTAQTSDACNVGIYSNTVISGVATPNTLLVSTGPLSTGTVANLTSAAAAISLLPNNTGNNLYWDAVICNSTTAIFRALPAAAVTAGLGYDPGTASAWTGYNAVGSGTTLPSTATGPFVLTTNVPIAIVGVQ